MRFCDKLLSLRKMKRYSQEQLADLLGISRQSVSKWESGQAMPELGKIIQISNLFSVPVDDLVRDERELVRESGQDIAFVKPTYSQEPVLKMENVASEEEIRKNILEMKDTIQQISKSVNAPAGFEYKSRVSIFGIPLVHIHFGKLFHVGVFPYNNACVAKGIFAAGDLAVGVVSFGAASFGIISLGGAAIGLLSVGIVAGIDARIGIFLNRYLCHRLCCHGDTRCCGDFRFCKDRSRNGGSKRTLPDAAWPRKQEYINGTGLPSLP